MLISALGSKEVLFLSNSPVYMPLTYGELNVYLLHVTCKMLILRQLASHLGSIVVEQWGSPYAQRGIEVHNWG